MASILKGGIEKSKLEDITASVDYEIEQLLHSAEEAFPVILKKLGDESAALAAHRIDMP